MKNKACFIKKLSLVFVIGIFLAFIIEINSFSYNELNLGNHQTQEQDNLDVKSTVENGDFIDTTVPSNPIEPGEIFEVYFEVYTELEFVGFDYNSSLFNVKSVNLVNKLYIVELSLNENALEAWFEFEVIIANDEYDWILTSDIFGYNSSNGWFISISSNSHAKESYINYMYLKGYIDENAYKKSITDLYNESIEEETSYTTKEKHNYKKITEWYHKSKSELVTDMLTNEENDNVNSGYVVNNLSSHDTYIQGTIRWRDDNNALHPYQYGYIGIYDESGIFESFLGSVYTDVNGYFFFSFKNDTSIFENGGYDLFIKAMSRGENTSVGTPFWESTYFVNSSVSVNVSTGSTTTKNLIINMSNDTGRAFQIAQALIYGSKYFQEMNGTSASSVSAQYPKGDSCYYNIFGIHLTENVYPFWDVILHEYGHHLQTILNISDSPGGDHSFTENLADRYSNKSKGIKLAWGEAWPTVFANLTTKYYASDLNNISNINDDRYDAYRNPSGSWSYNLESGPINNGEASEGSVLAVLFDLQDSGTNESFDQISLSHQQLWNYVKNSKAKTFSSFANYIYNNTSINKEDFAKLLEHYGMSPRNITVNAISMSPPTFNWIDGGGSTQFPNDFFNIVFYDSLNRELLRKDFLTSTTYTLTLTEWESVIYSYGTNFSIVIEAYQSDSPLTGVYRSPKTIFQKPTFSPPAENLYMAANNRYVERVSKVLPGQYHDFYTTFASSGQKIIQTFGPKDAYLEIFDSMNNRISYNNNSGYGLNAWIRFDAEANQQYKIRVRFYSSLEGGSIKLGITPSSVGSTQSSNMTDFNNIFNSVINAGLSLQTSTILNSTNLWTITITNTKTYTLLTDKYSTEYNYIDMYLYLIDPSSTTPCLYNDDGGGNLQAKIVTQLEAGKTYLLIISTYNITTQSGYFKLRVS